MAHPEQLEFVRRVRNEFPENFAERKVLEIGSWDVNGSVRQLFAECDYTGADVAEGCGVDLVCPGQRVDEPSCSFDTVISCECFEHNPYWLETFINMIRMLKPGGLCVMTCASTGRREHGTRRMSTAVSLSAKVDWFADYYRNLTAADFHGAMDLSKHFSDYFFFENIFSRDLYFCGIKNDPGQGNATLTQRMKHLQHATEEMKKFGLGTTKSHFKTQMKWLYNKALIGLVGEKTHRDLMFRKYTHTRSGSSERKAA